MKTIKQISVEEYHAEFLEKVPMNFSKFVRMALDDEMEARGYEDLKPDTKEEVEP